MHPDHTTSTPCANPEGERWLPIVGWPGYEISNWGRAHSYWRTGLVAMISRPKLMKGTWPKGYRRYYLMRHDGSGERRSFPAARLVLEAFVCPRPSGKEACHNDSNPANNRVDNLRWDTHSGNMIDRFLDGEDGSAKLAATDVILIWERLVLGDRVDRIATDYGVTSQAIYRIRCGATWSFITSAIPGPGPKRRRNRMATSRG